MDYTCDLLFSSAPRYVRKEQSHGNDDDKSHSIFSKQIVVQGIDIPDNMAITQRGFMGLPFLSNIVSDSPKDELKAICARDKLDSWANLLRRYEPAESMANLIKSCSSWINISQLDPSLENLTQVKLAHAVYETLKNANFDWWATRCRYKAYEEDSEADDLPFSRSRWPSPPLGTSTTIEFQWNPDKKVLHWFNLIIKKTVEISLEQFTDGTGILESMEDHEVFNHWIELRKKHISKRPILKRLGTTISRPRAQKPTDAAARRTCVARKMRKECKKRKGRKN
ncbi:hypothetical protein HER10_EVM0008556 [Colletotrichum scovillei]|uniref:Uncharacterized protein n=1 Tax=Colletotrichum scovillei TaxID=1209932 RepID=A0A9P7RET4_9PEZI|nr:uncharacterized protein HER10_EVM0008556 [Colletotrichum scovillei]KAF4784451.1 hypothetical protein HER10_EVM0008556 [Colletotrichum scovillei]KAG7054319.1 hypothetical protein JMJ77_0001386 [Colletotrichum scovillei]KAG7072612.1 hypothetical protein JMJ76_0005459 [Colletotrichum scovillei]KAG7080886.1 hypothetical protein JMJ78_0007969 [Colletotrichum scovillei]